MVSPTARRPSVVAHVLEMKRDEALQVNAENGQPLLHIARNQQGPVIRLLQADTQVELPGKLRITAGAIEMRARAGPCASTHPTTWRSSGGHSPQLTEACREIPGQRKSPVCP